jgi:hypothetical protein
LASEPIIEKASLKWSRVTAVQAARHGRLLLAAGLFWLSMILSENRLPPFGITLQITMPRGFFMIEGIAGEI